LHILQLLEKLALTDPSQSKTSRSKSPNPRYAMDSRKNINHVEYAQKEFLETETKVENCCTQQFNNDGTNKYESLSDNGSEISDEGYRSLGLMQSNNAKLAMLINQSSDQGAGAEILDTNGKFFFFKNYQ
jgi:hypothetical protein